MGKYIFADNGLRSGRADATVFMRNGVFRDWFDPANTSSSYRSFIRNSFAIYNTTWSTLTQSEMIQWNNFSIKHKNTFKQNIYVNGKDAFISCNIRMAIVNADNSTIWVEVPSVQQVKPLEFIISPLNAIKIQINSINSVNPDPVIVSTTQNLSPGTFKPRQCDFRIIGVVDFSTLPSINVKSLFFTRYLITPVVGQKIFVRTQVISPSGLPSTIFQTSSLVS